MKNLTFTLFLFVFTMGFVLTVYSQNNEKSLTQEIKETFQSTNKSDVVNPDEPLFEVKNDLGQTVFAVYSNGVKIFIDDRYKATGGGFTVGRLSTGKTVSEDFFQVNPGNVRINISDNDNDLKATGGGFTVGRLSTGKSTSEDFLSVVPGRVRVNIADDGTAGGFSVGRIGSGQVSGDDYEFLTVTPDSTRISISEQGAMSDNGGFAINQIKKDNYSREKFMKLSLRNIAIGHHSGISISSGLYNSFVGYESGMTNSSGEYNSFFGYQSGILNNNGSRNVFIGSKAGSSNIESSYNTYVGVNAGKNAATDYNTCIGFESGMNGSSGKNRAYFGSGSGYNNTGDDNTFIGTQAGYLSENSSRNVYLGKSAGKTANGSGNIIIGYNAGANFKGSNSLIIHNSAASNPLLYGEFFNSLLQINGNMGIRRRPMVNQFELEGNASKTVAGSWLANSDKRIKTQISEISNASEIILNLHPVKFKYTNEWKKLHPSIEDKFYYNFIAQEFQSVFPESVKGSGEYIENDNKEILQIDTYNAQIVSIKAIQELILQNLKQQTEIEKLKETISKMDTERQQLNAKYNEMEANLNKISNDLVQIKSLLLQSNK